MQNIKKSEYRAYGWIKTELQKAGWNTRNPETDPVGEVYYQQECLNHPEIRKVLGRQRPEFVIKLNETDYWIIEAKGSIFDLEKAFSEAVEYGEDLNQSSILTAKIVTGVAGTDSDEMLVKTAFLENGKYRIVTYNEEEITSILTRKNAMQLLDQNTAKLQDLIPDERVLLSTAEDVNEVLHEGAINKEARSRVISSLILAMIEPGELEPRADCQVFIDNINSRARQSLKKYGKETFAQSIMLYLPEKENAQRKYKNALLKTYYLLKKIDIKAAMYSGTDVLGKFYEVFLKYGNGAKDIGIVLTPRHITRFACEALKISYTDVIYDPTCGTGGFLVAAFDYVREHYTKEQTDQFKENKIFGIEQDSAVATMAIINMIFRGDGRSNIVNDDCFAEHLVKHMENSVETARYSTLKEMEKSGSGKNEKEGPVRKVLMNPPFSKKNENEKEYRFIQHALAQMETGGLLFAIVPTSVMIKTGKLKKWREQLLRENTLKAVVTFPDDLFYPVGTRTVGIFVQKGIKHDYKKSRVLWARIQHDGFVKSKGKRLPDEHAANELQEILGYLKIHLYDDSLVRNTIPEQMKVCLLNQDDKNLELMPEVYLDEKEDSMQQLYEQTERYILEYLAYLIKSGVKLKINTEEETKDKKNQEKGVLKKPEYKEMALCDFARSSSRKGDVHSQAEVSEGKMPLISCKTEDNGIAFYCDIEEDTCVRHCLTIAGDGSFPVTAYYHYDKVNAYDNVTLIPLRYDMSLESIFFLASRLNRSRWRYSYGRKCYPEKVKELKVCLPVTKDNQLDEDFIKKLFQQVYGWKEISAYIKNKIVQE